MLWYRRPWSHRNSSSDGEAPQLVSLEAPENRPLLWFEQSVAEPRLEDTDSTVWLDDLRRPKALCSDEGDGAIWLAGGELDPLCELRFVRLLVFCGWLCVEDVDGGWRWMELAVVGSWPLAESLEKERRPLEWSECVLPLAVRE